MKEDSSISLILVIISVVLLALLSILSNYFIFFNGVLFSLPLSLILVIISLIVGVRMKKKGRNGVLNKSGKILGIIFFIIYGILLLLVLLALFRPI